MSRGVRDRSVVDAPPCALVVAAVSRAKYGIPTPKAPQNRCARFGRTLSGLPKLAPGQPPRRRP